jgi:hypothetical protein
VIAAFAHGTKGRKHSRSPRHVTRKANVPRPTPRSTNRSAVPKGAR